MERPHSFFKAQLAILSIALIFGFILLPGFNANVKLTYQSGGGDLFVNTLNASGGVQGSGELSSPGMTSFGATVLPGGSITVNVSGEGAEGLSYAVSIDAPPVPEPGAGALGAVGALAALLRRRRPDGDERQG